MHHLFVCQPGQGVLAGRVGTFNFPKGTTESKGLSQRSAGFVARVDTGSPRPLSREAYGRRPLIADILVP